MTFSIVAYDAAANEWGVATQSKFLAVGAVVPWAQANAGAIATQSYANTSFGPKGLALLSTGLSAPDALDRLLADDDGREHRQVGVVDQLGGAATFTGKDCHAWAGGLIGNGYAVQGNILVSEATVVAIANGFENAAGELADRLVAALAAGQRAGGDRRGRQSAAVLVVRERGGYAGFNDRYLDLRVDDDPKPIERLQQMLELHHLYFAKPDPATLIPIDAALARELQRIAQRSGHYRGALTGEYDTATRAAVEALIGTENLEDRWPPGTDQIEPVALRYLQQLYPAPK
ncbi:MAG TPA: DUF1028 domain-containing protein [Anaerolineae bacterium]|nr:DUF1028 domain-containing protein [Anaerolineae bacterium]